MTSISIGIITIASISLFISITTPLIISTAYVLKRITESDCFCCKFTTDIHDEKEKEKVLENDKNK